MGVALPTNTPHTRESAEAQSTIINTDADDKIERIYNEFDKIAFFLGFFDGNGAEEDDGSMEEDIKGRNGKVGERSKKLAPGKAAIVMLWLELIIRMAYVRVTSGKFNISNN